MSKKLCLKIRATRHCSDCKDVAVHVEDYVNGSRRIESKGVSHKTVRDVEWIGHDGDVVGTEYDITLGVRKRN